MKHLSGMIAPGDGRTFAARIGFDERIASIEAAAPGGRDYVLPGLIDLQVNGSHGIDVMSAEPSELAMLADQLAREGTTAFVPTAITAPLEKIERVHSAIGDAMVEQSSDRRASAAILGMHLEGPFISSRRLGAHPRLDLEPRGAELERVLGLEKLRIITLAPELAGASEAIRRLCSRDVTVSIGHTNATFAEANSAIDAGARMFTHLFNAMRPIHHRDPGVIGAAMLSGRAIPAVIPDGVHVDAAILRLICRVRGAAGVILTADKAALAGRAADSPLAGGSRARIERGAARFEDGTLAGSVISMLEGVRVMVNKVGVCIGEAAMMAAANPAAMLRIEDRGRIRIGARADLLLLSQDLDLKAVFIGGREVT